MPPLSLHALSLCAPDGRVLLEPTTLSLPPGACGLIGANGAGKSTLLRALAGESAPAAGRVACPGRVRRIDPRETGPALAAALAELADALPTLDAGSRRDIARLRPFEALADGASPGQRTRAWLAVAAASDADWLLLDEPSAHLDAEGRSWLREWLSRPGPSRLVASHDRGLLDGLPRLVLLEGGTLRAHGGGWTDFAQGHAQAKSRARDALARLRREAGEAAARAQRERERAQQRAARGAAAVRDGSQGRLLQGYLQSRAGQGERRRERAIDRREELAAAALAQARAGAWTPPAFSLDLPGEPVGADRLLLSLQGIGLRGADGWLLEGFDLVITGPRRLWLRGGNGRGKSRLLQVMAGTLAPDAGQRRAGSLPVLHLEQGLRAGGRVLDAFLARQPLPEAEARERLARFLFRGDAVHQPVATLSSGEALRLAFACALGGPRSPGLLLLDEPDNHLDLPSLRVVEHALSQFRGGLVLVSHDEAFAAAVGLQETIRLG